MNKEFNQKGCCYNSLANSANKSALLFVFLCLYVAAAVQSAAPRPACEVVGAAKCDKGDSWFLMARYDVGYQSSLRKLSPEQFIAFVGQSGLPRAPWDVPFRLRDRLVM